jgi:hypothetical protein
MFWVTFTFKPQFYADWGNLLLVTKSLLAIAIEFEVSISLIELIQNSTIKNLANKN